jgi:hypothetical protein
MFLKPPLPKEHGSWAMLIVPVLVGLTLAPAWHWRVLGLLVAAFSFFLMRYPLATLVKTRKRTYTDKPYLWRWTAIYGSIAVLSGSWLILAYGLWWLLVVGVVGGLLIGLHLWFVARRQEMSATGELAAIFGLALGAPMAYYVAGGQLDDTAALLWLMNALYFGGTVFYIKLKVRHQPRMAVPAHPGRRFLEAKSCLGYQTMALTIIILLATLRLAPLLAPLALIPATLKAVFGAWQWQEKKSLSLVRLGVVEIFHAVAFAGLVIWAFRSGQLL